MSFRGHLRPGQGFRPFRVLRRVIGVTEKGRPHTGELEEAGCFLAIISQASPREQEQWKQLGTPISHTVLQRGTKNRARGNDVLELVQKEGCGETRRFLVQGQPHDPGELGHFLVYHVLERADLQ